MSDDGLLTAEQLHKITGKKRSHCQQAWFKEAFGVLLPRNTERVIVSRQLFESLQAKRAGLIQSDVPADRPKIYSVKKTA
ncbi:MAG: DUF4224 domain-containing protein [Bacillota bacterium]